MTTTNYYLVINGIAGDYSDALLTGAFQVASFNELTTTPATLLTVGQTAFGELELSLSTQALAGLLAASANGTLTNVSLVGETTVNGVSKIDYSLNLGDVILGSILASSSADTNLTLAYNQFGLVTTGFNPDGTPQPSQSFGWDLLQHKSTGPGTSLTSAGSPAIAPTVPTSYFLLIDGMNGGAVQKSHIGWFNLDNFGVNLANTTNPLNLAGGGADEFSPLSVAFRGDNGLVQLLQQETDGKPLTGVRIEGVNASGQAVYDLNLANVVVTDVKNLGPSAVSVSLDYQQVSLVTKGQDNSGKLVQTGSFGWDRTTDTSIDPATMPTIAAGASHGSVAPSSYYLVIGGIAGDYTDKLVSGAFKLDGFTEDSVNSGSALTGRGPTTFGALSLTLDNDLAVAALLQASAAGTDIKNVSIVGESLTAGSPAITYSLNLAKVIVSDVATSGNTDLTLKYDQLGLVTKGLDSTGALQTAQTFGWDAQTKTTTTQPGLSLTSAGSPAVPPALPTSYYLLIDGMNGGSTDANHRAGSGSIVFRSLSAIRPIRSISPPVARVRSASLVCRSCRMMR